MSFPKGMEVLISIAPLNRMILSLSSVSSDSWGFLLGFCTMSC